MSANAFQPGDRVRYVGPRYRNADVFGRLHYVERCWEEVHHFGPHTMTVHRLQLLGIARPCPALCFHLAHRARQPA